VEADALSRPELDPPDAHGIRFGEEALADHAVPFHGLFHLGLAQVVHHVSISA